MTGLNHAGGGNGFKSARARFLGTTILVTLLTGPALAQQTYDNGAGTGLWNTIDDNWNPGAGFIPTGDAILSDTDGTVTISGGGIAAGNVTVLDGGVGILIVDGDPLTLTGSIDVNADAAANISANIIGDATSVGAGALTVGAVGGNATNFGTGSLTLSGAVTGNFTNTTGTTSIIDGATVGGTATIDGGSVTINATNDGTLEVVGTTTLNDGVLALSDGNLGAVVNNGTTGGGTEITLTAGEVASLDNNSGETTIAGATITGATTVDGGTVTNTGGTLAGVTTTAGLYDQNGGSSTDVTNNGGNVNIDGGTAASLTNGAGAGISTVTDGQVTGATTVNGGSVVVNETTVDAALELVGASTVSNGTLTVTAGDVGDVNVDGAGGTFDQNGGTADLVTNSAGTVTLDGGTTDQLVATGGTSTVTGGQVTGTTTVNGGDVVVNGTTGGAVELQGDTTLTTGTLTLTAGDVGNVINNGTNGGGTDVTLTAGNVASLDNNSGETDIAGATITGATTVDGGTVTNNNGTLAGVTTTAGLYDQNGGSSGAVTNNGGNVNIDGGTAASLTNGAGAGTSTVTDGQVTGTTTINGGAVVVNGTTGGAVELQGDTTLNNGTLTLTAGDVGNVINNGTNGGGTEVTLTAGNVAGLDNNSGETDIAGATITGATTVDGGTVTSTNGTLNTVTTTAGTFTQSGGTSTTVTNNGGDVNLDGGTATALVNGATAGTTTVTDGQVTGTSTISGGSVVVNETTVDAALELVGASTVQGTGTLTLDAGDVGNVNVTAAGATFDQNAGTSDIVTNTGGTVTLDGGTTDQLVSNGGTSAVNGANVTTATNDAGTLTVGAGGTIDTLNNNTAFTFNNGTINNVNNTSTFTVDGARTMTGAFNNTGGTLDLNAGGTLVANTLTNQAGGTVNVGGGETVTATTTNTGAGSTLNVGGTMNGGVTNLADAAINLQTGGVINGGVNNNATFNFGAAGSTVNGGFTNDTGGTTTLSATSTSTVNGGFTNGGSGAGTLTMANGASLSVAGGSFTNGTGGSVDVSDGTATINGSVALNAGSTVNLTGGGTDESLNINGATSMGGNTISLDANLTGTGASDSVNVTGALTLTGDVTLSFSTVGQDDINPVNVVTYSSLAPGAFTFNAANLPQFGTFEYFLNTGATAVTLQSRINDGVGNLAAGVGLTQSVVGSIINRPTSPYVTDYVGYSGESRNRAKRQADTSRPCGPGGWARISAGQADVDGSFSSSGSAPVGSNLSLDYYGIQTGGDIACFDDRFGGYDMAFGLIAGYNAGDTFSASTEADISTDFSQAYAGLYATASRGSFFADLQLRFENIDYEASIVDNIAANGTIQTISDFSTSGTTVSGSVGYSWQIPSVEGLSFVSTAGFSYSDFETDPITIESTLSGGGPAPDSTLQLQDSSIELGFVSATLARSRVLPDQLSAINYFGTVTYYNDFADNPTATLTESGSTTNIELSNLGSYGEVSLGVNYIRLLDSGGDGAPRQLSAAARVDYRSGDAVDSYGITGQVRLQW